MRTGFCGELLQRIIIYPSGILNLFLIPATNLQRNPYQVKNLPPNYLKKNNPNQWPHQNLLYAVVSSVSLIKKADEVGEEIATKPLKSFEKKEREKIVQSFERIIFKMVREINNSRQ